MPRAAEPRRRNVQRFPLTLAVLTSDSLALTHLRVTLRARAELLACGQLDDLVLLLARRRVDLIVVAPWDASGARVAPILREIRDRLPSVPVVVYCTLGAAAVREIVALAKSGADEVILRGIDDDSSEIWSRLLVSVHRRAADQALLALRPLLPNEVEPIVSYCLERAEKGVRVEEVAAALHLHRRTLVHRMATAGMPAPSSLISWCRLLLAARLLEDPGRAVEQVALTLGYSSGAALRNMMRRYTGLRPSELREHGGLQCVVQLLRSSIEAPKPARGFG